MFSFNQNRPPVAHWSGYTLKLAHPTGIGAKNAAHFTKFLPRTVELAIDFQPL
ncbi:hypothetical protein IEN85_03040 [Pelagicoccus sp. NFK12]|uniref:Uncharacterized protein n=1 Tax=Pelagicoccus enzymogenes TaxID=2773457 RepID=A0A927IG53_9BACT|nr:hypothetical protein [Pelagicoccus enzymogenes]MBD5778454.1 hypothetical protein [Pelagicoccus enzymogenes]MDQ8197185.1 hypothetical protein [Pelagicoccus enzymogenes]